MCLCVYVCVEKAEVCLFQGMTILNPGQSMVQYFEGELCYTVQCLTNKDPSTGFYAMDVTTANCSEKCEPVSHMTNATFSRCIHRYFHKYEKRCMIFHSIHENEFEKGCKMKENSSFKLNISMYNIDLG